jgi:tetratricopeptide (TPR) repeat protein
MAVLLVAGAAVAAADDLDSNYQSLQEAVAKKDAAQVKKLAPETSVLARQELKVPAPEGGDMDAWKERVKYATDVDLYTEYALYATAVQSEPATMVDLLATLEQQNPKSKYLDDAYGPYLAAVTKTAGAAKALEVADKAVASNPENIALLTFLADNAMAKGQTDRALGFANRTIAAGTKHPKPETATAADWERERSVALGRGYWIAGIISGQRGRYVDADRDLRAALPLIKGNDAMMGPALYTLGIANYTLGKMTLKKARMLEGAKFCEQAASINWANSQQAYHDSLAIKKEADAMR